MTSNIKNLGGIETEGMMIVDGLPPPLYKRTIRYPFAEMRVGQTLVLSASHPGAKTNAVKVSRAQYAAYNFTRRNPECKFTGTVGKDGTVQIYRLA